jgi:hypothetical protein
MVIMFRIKYRSKIAQNHKENYPYGIIEWDLFDKEKTKFIEIKNSYDFVTIHIKNGVMIETEISQIKLTFNNHIKITYKCCWN